MKELSELEKENRLYQFNTVKRVACGLVERRAEDQQTSEHLLGCAIDACNMIHSPEMYTWTMYEKIRNWTVARLHRQLEGQYQTTMGGPREVPTIEASEKFKTVLDN